MAVSKLQILRETHRKDDGTTLLDGQLLALPNPILTPVGKIDEDRLLCYDSDTKTLITIDLFRNEVVKVLSRDAFLGIFPGGSNQSSFKPAIGPPAPVKLQNGWLLCYESTTKSLFGVRADPDGGPGVVANLVSDQSQMQGELFPSGVKKPVTISKLFEFQPDHVLMVPFNNLTAIHHLIIQDHLTTLEGHFVLGRDPVDPPTVPPSIPLLDYEAVKVQTSQVSVDLKDFSPIAIPGTGQVLLFDRAKASSAFLVLSIKVELEPLYHTSKLELASTRQDLVNALAAAKAASSEDFDGEFRFTVTFYHPDATLDPGNPNRVPWILAWDTINFGIIAFDFTKPRGAADKLTLFSSKTDLSNRTDLRFDPELDVATLDPSLAFAANDSVANRLAFDSAISELLSLSYDTGQWVVVLHGRDVTPVTGSSQVNFKYIETLDPPPDGNGLQIRALDGPSATIVKLKVQYMPIPVSFPH